MFPLFPPWQSFRFFTTNPFCVLAIFQVFMDNFFGNHSGFIDKIFLAIFQVFSTKSFCQSFIFLTTNPTTYLVAQGLAERSGLKGEVLARAAPSSTSQVGGVQHNNNKSGGAQNNNKPPHNTTQHNLDQTCFYQMAALFTGRDSSGLGLRRAPSLSKLSRAPSLSKLARNFKGSSMD